MALAAETLVTRLVDWGVDTVFGLPGDSINGLFEALRRAGWEGPIAGGGRGGGSSSARRSSCTPPSAGLGVNHLVQRRTGGWDGVHEVVAR
jgi:hypothetical protein